MKTETARYIRLGSDNWSMTTKSTFSCSFNELKKRTVALVKILRRREYHLPHTSLGTDDVNITQFGRAETVQIWTFGGPSRFSNLRTTKEHQVNAF